MAGDVGETKLMIGDVSSNSLISAYEYVRVVVARVGRQNVLYIDVEKLWFGF